MNVDAVRPAFALTLMLACAAPLGAPHLTALCESDAALDMAVVAVDAAIDMAIDASPGIDLMTPWPMQTIVSHDDCRGADGVDVATIGGKRVIAVPCEQGAKAGYAREDAPEVWTWRPFTEQLQGPEDAIWCDADGDLDLDFFVAEQVGRRISMWTNQGNETWGAREIIVQENISTGQLFNRLFCVSPGIIYSGSYGTGASVDMYVRNEAGAWVKTQISTAGVAQTFQPFEGDYLFWDGTGSKRGVRKLLAGTRLTTDVYTQFGMEKGGRITTGTANPTTGVSTIAIIGEPAITYPSVAGWYHDSDLGDLDGDGLDDLAVVTSHAFAGLHFTFWLKAPSWEFGWISGPTPGTKGDHGLLVDWRVPGVLDLLTTEEDELGLVLFRNPRTP